MRLFALLILLVIIEGSRPWIYSDDAPASHSPAIASVSLFYDIINQDINDVQNRIVLQFAYAMGKRNESSSFGMLHFNWLSRSYCAGFFGSPSLNPPLESNPFPNPRAPNWAALPDGVEAASHSGVCVSPTNSSVIVNGTLLQSTFVTGERDASAVRAYSPDSPALLWFQGFEYTKAIQLLNTLWASHLNTTVDLASLGVDPSNPPLQVAISFVASFYPSFGIPICPAMVLRGSGCFNATVGVDASAGLTQYEIRYRSVLWPNYFQSLANDVNGTFFMDLPWDGSLVPSAPVYTSFVQTTSTTDPWEFISFPQSIWVAQHPACTVGLACSTLTIAPSPRYYHTATLYKSWNFKRDVLGHATLCKLNSRQDNSACGPDCLTNTTCIAPPGQASTWTMGQYYSLVITAGFWAASQWVADDGQSEPFYDPHDIQCPPNCCGNRRTCTRVRDELGYPVPFDREYMLVFGGRTRELANVSGVDFFSNCELLRNEYPNLDPTFASCLEYQSDELWRYDIADKTWDLIKPQTGLTSSGQSMGYPPGRYAHAAVMITINASNDPYGARRVYMYIFGGLGNSCNLGVCPDVWKFEVPWAAKAYWPSTTMSYANWQRGAKWTRLGDNPFGGFYQHTMQATSSGAEIYSFGGHQPGRWSNDVFQYRVVSDTWQAIQSLGYSSFSRTAVDYTGKTRVDTFTDLSRLREDFPEEDVYSSTVPRGSGGQQPYARGSAASFTYDVLEPSTNISHTIILMMSGYRTFDSPYPGDGFPFPTYPYYLDDTWRFNTTSYTWSQVFFDSASATPLPRRGASAIPIVSPAGALQTLMYGGHNQDEPLNDIWINEVSATPKSARKWKRIDNRVTGVHPPASAYQSMVKSSLSGSIIVFGGLTWFHANLTTSETLRNLDLRCLKSARGVVSQYADVEDAKSSISEACTENANGFCCANIAAVKAAADLIAISLICKAVCQEQSFQSLFAPVYSEGMWMLNMSRCVNDCSGNGACVQNNCVCMSGWYGVDCSKALCPGSACYTNPLNQEQFCTFCSHHGTCNDGNCTCSTGWGDHDCSMTLCRSDCSSQGACIADYPVNQCICSGTFSGETCNMQLCLNNCSANGNCTGGVCSCSTGYYGPDCSLYVPGASAYIQRLTMLSLLVLFYLDF